MLLEVCANSLASAIVAQNCGAQRIELCQNLMVGGTTPSAATIQLCRNKLDIDIFVLIRPRAGDFVYSDLEVELMIKNIEFCKRTGVEGVVIGGLTPDGSINIAMMKELMTAANGLQVTFHRAFDYVPDPIKSLTQLNELGVNRVLTSGQKETAFEGKALIAQLVQASENLDINILPGSGININNVKALIETTEVKEIHLSAKSLIPSKATYPSLVGLNQKEGDSENDYFQTDPKKLREIVALIAQM